MLPIRGFLLLCSTACLAFAQAAPPKQLTARELFYAAAQAPAKTDSARAPAKRPARITPKPVEIARAEVRPSAPRPSEPVVQAAASKPAPTTAPMPASGAPPLGMRY